MTLDDLIALGLLLMILGAVIYIPMRGRFLSRRKREEENLEVPPNSDTTVYEIEAKVSIEFQRRMVRTEMVWLICIVVVAISLITVAYMTHFRKSHAFAGLTTITASYAFLSLRKRFAASREDAKNVSLSLCQQWLTYKHPSGENRIKLESIRRVTYCSNRYSDLSVTAENGRTAHFLGFDNAEDIYLAVRRVVEHRKT